MIKAVGIIMSRNRKIIGMVFSGKPKELGRISNESEIQEMVDMQKAQMLLKVCKNFTWDNGVIVPKANEKLTDLKMFTETTNGVVQVNNGITIVSKIVEEGTNKIIGFGIRFNSTNENARYYYKDVVTLASFYKPRNFVVRTKGDTEYIAGKSNVMNLDELPAEMIPAKNKKKSRKRAAANTGTSTTQKKAVDSEIEKENAKVKKSTDNPADIFTIINKIKELNGVIIYLPNEKYEMTKTTELSPDERFSPIGGMVAYPKLEHSSDAMKVNINFRKPGTLNLDGVQVLVYMNTYRTIIKNGFSNVKKLGIGIPQSKESELIDFIGSCGDSIRFSRLQETHLVQAVKTMLQIKDNSFYTIELDGVKTMNKQRIQCSEISSDKIYDMVVNTEKAKVIRKIAKEFIKALPADEKAEAMVHPAYRMYKEDIIQKMKEARVDISTGAFNNRVDGKTSTGSDEEESPIKIVYYLKGMTSIPKVSDLVNPEKKSATKDMFKEDIEKVLALKNDKSSLEALIKKCDKAIDGITEKLWLHKAAMLQKTDWKKVHVNDKEKWTELQARANVKGQYFSYVDNTKLILKIEGDVEM